MTPNMGRIIYRHHEGGILLYRDRHTRQPGQAIHNIQN